MTSTFLFLLGSARSGGNTETLARRAAASLPTCTEQRWLWLRDVPLPPYRDVRHDTRYRDGAGDTMPTGNEKLLLDATLNATDLVIASPVYWYSVSADTKTYLDYWTNWMRLPDGRFLDSMRKKTLWGITVLAEGPEQAEPLVSVLRMSAAYLHMRWGGALIGNGSKPGNILDHHAALEAARTFFQCAPTTRSVA